MTHPPAGEYELLALSVIRSRSDSLGALGQFLLKALRGVEGSDTIERLRAAVGNQESRRVRFEFLNADRSEQRIRYGLIDLPLAVLEDLKELDLFIEARDFIRCDKLVLLLHGLVLLVERPAAVVGCELVWDHDYFSDYSVELAQFIRDRQPRGRVLDLGSGTGIQALVLCETAHEVIAVDIEEGCRRETQLNAALNGYEVTVVASDWLDSLDGTFDCIVCNPPWRIVPPGVPYPNPTARVGGGCDGLDDTRAILTIGAAALATGGSIFLICELPCRRSRSVDLDLFGLRNPDARFEVTLHQLGRPTSIADMIERSVLMSKSVEPSVDVDHVRELFSVTYRRLNADSLLPVVIEVTRLSRPRGTQDH